MKIEKGSGADKFWTGIIGIFLLLELIYFVKFLTEFNWEALKSNDWVKFSCESLLYIMVVLLFTEISEDEVSNKPYSKIMLLLTLCLIPLIILLPGILAGFIISVVGYYLIQGGKKFLNFINNWANDRF